MKIKSEEILKICQKFLKSKKINLNSKIDEISDWDSIRHVTLISDLEKKYKIKISFEDSLSITSIKDIIKIVNKVK